MCVRVGLSQRCSFNSHLVLFASVKICWESAPFQLKQAKVLFFQWSIAIIHVHEHVQIWTRAEKWIRTLQFMGPRQAKKGLKFKILFFRIVYTGYKPHHLVAPPKRRAEAHRALENCDCMHEQTDFSTFSAKKAQKRRFLPKNAIKGERNELFQKGRKRTKKGRAPLGKGYLRVCACECMCMWEKEGSVGVCVSIFLFLFITTSQDSVETPANVKGVGDCQPRR